ncbi:MAG: HAMP domain-containing protein [Candidatus Eisenbacteria bacterium]|nr:HAMP domain-containing protein [Candidatus Eisenbacteria bacterium]
MFVRSRLLWKLYAGYVTLILGSAFIIGAFVSRGIERDSIARTRRNLEAEAILLREISWKALSGERDPSLQGRVEDLGGRIGTRFTVIRSDGVVIADSEMDPARMDNHGDRQEVRAARGGESGTATRFSDTVGMRMMYLAIPVRRGDHLLGFVRASLPLTDVDRRLGQIRAVVVLTVVIASALALLIGFFLARRVTEPLVRMTRAAMAVAGGEYDHPLEILSNDEVGDLGRAFNSMIEQLRARMETIVLDRNKVVAILSSMVEGVIAVDRSEKVLHINSVAARIIGADADRAVGRRISAATHVRTVSELLSRTMREVRDLTSETRVVSGGDERFIEMKASPLRDRDDRLAGAVLVLHDVTELRRLEAIRKDFVANISHELKTPVTAIRGLVETMIDDPEMEPARSRDFLGRINEQTARLTNLVTDLLAVSRLESKDGAADRELVDLRVPVRESLEGLLPVARSKGLHLETGIPEFPLPVSGDAEGLRQIADNLLDNALKYTPAGGKIWVRLRDDGSAVTLEVEDTGIGIDKEHQARIFERFYRVDKARSRRLGGTGLGLAIVKHQALAMGGSVSLESTPGAGSVFRVRFPSAAPRPAPPSPPSLFESGN